MAHDQHEVGTYFVPQYSKLPFFTALSLFLLGYGSLNLVDPSTFGIIIFMLGAIALTAVLTGWFKETIKETRAGLHDAQMLRSYRWGMFWFLFADFTLFGIFYMAYFYAKYVTVPDMAGIGGYPNSTLGHLLLWPNFNYAWPLLVNPNPTSFSGSLGALNPWGIPALNTLFMIVSAMTSFVALQQIKKNRQNLAITGLVITLLLGAAFIVSQMFGMRLASSLLGLKLSSGIYGSTLFMLTGMHLAHVIVAWFILFIITIRTIRGAFKQDVFAFEAASWFWLFLTFIYVLLFLLVYL